MKRITYGLYILTCIVLIATTIIERFVNVNANEHIIYDSPWFVALWAILAIASLGYIFKKQLYRRPIVFILHCSYIVILLGALITWLFAERGYIHLREGEPTSAYFNEKGQIKQLPFEVKLNEFKIINYNGTQTPQDYISQIIIQENEEFNISMNSIATYNGYRFYQSSYDDDKKGSLLSLSHDPWGIGITYAGYILLLFSILMFFFDKKSQFRRLLTTSALSLLFILLPSCSDDTVQLKTIDAETANRFGELKVLYNGRICPIQTLAIDVTTKLYGRPTYKNLSAEQVLLGIITDIDNWENEKIIKIKSSEIRQAMSANSKYVSVNQLYEAQEKGLLKHISPQEISELNERLAIMLMVNSGEMLKIYPTSEPSGTEWHSCTDILANENDSIDKFTTKIMSYQQNEMRHIIPSNIAFNAEKLYNKSQYMRFVYITLLTIGIALFVIMCIKTSRQQKINQLAEKILFVITTIVFIYLTYINALRWIISGHIPLSNGPEMMQILSWCSIGMIFILYRRYNMIMPFGYIVGGLTILVSTIGTTNPQITQLMPVLSSPLLSIHVAIIMISYSLLSIELLNSLTAIILHTPIQTKRLEQIGRIILYPAIFCLTIGIFIGAVWANQSWGRYWGWDPKEVWALITMMIYTLPIHLHSISGKRFHWFMIIAFLSVLITYFGVNYILGGMHSYV